MQLTINQLIAALQEKAGELGGESPVVAWVLEEGTKASPLTKLAVSRVSPGYDKAQGKAVAILHLTKP